MPEIADWI